MPSRARCCTSGFQPSGIPTAALPRVRSAHWQRTFAEFSQHGVAGPCRPRTPRCEISTSRRRCSPAACVHLHGRVLEATPWRQGRPQTIVFRQPDTAKYLGTCDRWTAQDAALIPRASVELTGLATCRYFRLQAAPSAVASRWCARRRPDALGAQLNRAASRRCRPRGPERPAPASSAAIVCTRVVSLGSSRRAAEFPAPALAPPCRGLRGAARRSSPHASPANAVRVRGRGNPDDVVVS